MIKIKEETNQIEIKKKTCKINESKNWFFEKKQQNNSWLAQVIKKIDIMNLKDQYNTLDDEFIMQNIHS